MVAATRSSRSTSSHSAGTCSAGDDGVGAGQAESAAGLAAESSLLVIRRAVGIQAGHRADSVAAIDDGADRTCR